MNFLKIPICQWQTPHSKPQGAESSPWAALWSSSKEVEDEVPRRKSVVKVGPKKFRWDINPGFV